jgi:hypothetical protein
LIQKLLTVEEIVKEIIFDCKKDLQLVGG